MKKTVVGSDRFDLLEILRKGSAIWNQWRLDHPDEHLILIEADLSFADLREVNLSEVNLIGANLSGANLSGANLSGANLIGANLIGAILIEVANLSDATEIGANLSGANLSDTYLSGANLRGVNLSDANLRGANLRGVNLSDAYLREADLSEADLRGANLRGANLRGANLRGAALRGADLRGAKLPLLFRLISSFFYLNDSILDIIDAIGDISQPNSKSSLESSELFSINVFDQDTDESDLAQLQAAIANFAEACGYSDPESERPIRGSFFQKIKYVTTTIPANKIIKGFKLGKGLFTWGRDKVIQSSGNEYKATKDIAEATAALIIAVDKFDNAVLTVGRAMIIKKTVNGETLLYATTISLELQKQLENNPIPMNCPQDAIDFLEARSALPEAMVSQVKAIAPASEAS